MHEGGGPIRGTLFGLGHNGLEGLDKALTHSIGLMVSGSHLVMLDTKGVQEGPKPARLESRVAVGGEPVPLAKMGEKKFKSPHGC